MPNISIGISVFAKYFGKYFPYLFLIESPSSMYDTADIFRLSVDGLIFPNPLAVRRSVDILMSLMFNNSFS